MESWFREVDLVKFISWTVDFMKVDSVRVDRVLTIPVLIIPLVLSLGWGVACETRSRGGHREHVNPPLILNSVLRVSLPSVILYNSHRLVNPLLIFLDRHCTFLLSANVREKNDSISEQKNHTLTKRPEVRFLTVSVSLAPLSGTNLVLLYP